MGQPFSSASGMGCDVATARQGARCFRAPFGAIDPPACAAQMLCESAENSRSLTAEDTSRRHLDSVPPWRRGPHVPRVIQVRSGRANSMVSTPVTSGNAIDASCVLSGGSTPTACKLHLGSPGNARRIAFGHACTVYRLEYGHPPPFRLSCLPPGRASFALIALIALALAPTSALVLARIGSK